MIPHRLFALAWLTLVLPLLAQTREPHVGYVYPAGGSRGSTFEVVIGGQYLNGARSAFCTGAGVETEVLEYNRPMAQKRFNELRDELRTLQQKRAAARRAQNSTNEWTEADAARVREIQGLILKNPPNRQGNPAIAERVTVRVTIAADAATGERELRVLTPNGLSNPLVFCIGRLPEVSRPPAQATGPELDRLRRQFDLAPDASASNEAVRLTLPVVVNGQIMPGGVERFRFAARRGQELVIAARARTLIPYLADAVPGWFQATLTLYDDKGGEIAYNDDYEFRPDPVLHCVAPRDGEYVVEIRDAIYRGREDFVYRIEIGELPFITSLFPLGGTVDTPVRVEVTGWNLAEQELELQEPEPGVEQIRPDLKQETLNTRPFAVEAGPDRDEVEPNETASSSQFLKQPVTVNGRIATPGDEDVFRLDGRAGDQLVAEVWARRLESPLDAVLTLSDASGKPLAFNDDFEDKACGLNTHHADSYVRVTLPRDGIYFLRLGDREGKGGPQYGYRLRVGAPKPDFALRVVPSAINVRPGGTVPITVHALRRDGLTNEIQVALKGAPAGFVLRGGPIPAGTNAAQFRLVAPASARSGVIDLLVEGRSETDGTVLVRRAVPADDQMQAFLYRHLVPAQELKLAVVRRGNAGTR